MTVYLFPHQEEIKVESNRKSVTLPTVAGQSVFTSGRLVAMSAGFWPQKSQVLVAMSDWFEHCDCGRGYYDPLRRPSVPPKKRGAQPGESTDKNIEPCRDKLMAGYDS